MPWLTSGLQPALGASNALDRSDLHKHLVALDDAFPNEMAFAFLQITAAYLLIVAAVIAVGFKLAVASFEYRIFLKPTAW